MADIKISVPDIGGAKDVDVIEVMIKPGDEVNKDSSLITLESDKASMEIPSPMAGKIKKVFVKLGDKISEGDPIALLVDEQGEESTKTTAQPLEKKEEQTPSTTKIEEVPVEPAKKETTEKATLTEPVSYMTTSEAVLAGPAVRRMARELGVDLSRVKGSGRKDRVSKDDLQGYVKSKLAEKETSLGFSLPPAQAIDFTKYGEIEAKPLNKIKRLTGMNVHRSWVTIPHVTQFDEADITELEVFRKFETDKAKANSVKLTLLAFVTKVVCKALTIYPQFNTSLDPSGENLIFKKYFNIGIAVETANGLVVPVIKNVDQLSVHDIAHEMSRLSSKAREKGLMPADMSGGCFTISSLGGIGGTAFTPIVNSPEVAILGLSRSSMKPIYENGEFKPRLMLPLSLSYDHRVIDGAEAARFTRYLAECLSDIRRILL